ncbi:MAG: hypothetical protein IKU73_00420 [Clostridia bacterium]|nr:hypothetical protein [Clostridia bacterium]
MSFTCKHRTILSVLIALMAAIAAPYMLPANPDSAVFRSGILSLLLFAGCIQPIQDVLKRTQPRQMVVSLCLGYFFALALSLGSELFVYQGLLRGFGSFVRRTAVPVLAAPLFGCLCCRITMAKPLSSSNRFKLPFLVYMLIIFLCWAPVWLAFWPANIRYDFVGEYNQHLAGQYTSLHPLFHSIIQNNIITLGEKLADRTFGLMLLTLVQMLGFSASLAACCVFLANRGAGLASLALAFVFGLHPTFSVLAVSTTKDTMFAAAVVAHALMIWSLLEAPDAFFASKRKWLAFTAITVLTALLRNNGLFALVLALPALVIAARGHRKQALLLSVSGVLASLAVFSISSFLYHCESMPSRQLYSLPAQQLVRAYNLSPNLTDEDREEIRSWYLSDAGLVLLPQLADPAKGYLNEDLLQEKGGDQYLSLWASHLKDSMHEYIEAFLLLNLGSWYPDDLTHAMIYPEQAWNGQGYLSLAPIETTNQGFEMTCYLPAVRNIIERICSSNRYQRFPLLSLTFCPAAPFWMIMLACSIIISKKRTCLLPATAGVLGLYFSYLMGPCTLPRYSLPLFALAPVLLIAALCLRAPSDSSSERKASHAYNPLTPFQ